MPHVHIDAFDFFRREEVKNALALAHLALDRNEISARRVAARRRLMPKVEPVLQDIDRHGHPVGLRFVDLLKSEVVTAGDPLWGLNAPSLVVLDTETTGLDVGIDEVIDVAAVRLDRGQITERHHALIQPKGPIGEGVHGISENELARHGRNKAEVLEELSRFIGDTPIAGHNVFGFDKRMLETDVAKVEVNLKLSIGIDTFTAARRLVPSLPNHTLASVTEYFQVKSTPTHRAMDDVLATVEIIPPLAKLAAQNVAERRRLIAEYAPRVAPLRDALDSWAESNPRPGVLLRTISQDALIPKISQTEPHRVANLMKLIRQVENMDDHRLSPVDAMRKITQRAALSRNVDLIDSQPGIRVMTIHQSKGLEFEEIILPSLVEGVLPNYHSTLSSAPPDALDEELKLLYVAVTRARRRLHLSWHHKNKSGHSCNMSRFLRPLTFLLH